MLSHQQLSLKFGIFMKLFLFSLLFFDYVVIFIHIKRKLYVRVCFSVAQEANRLHMGRDNGMNVHSTREQIICRSMREHIGLHIVTAGATVPAAFAGVHRNHHFDTIQRLHPLLHPLNTGDAPSPFDIGLDYSSFCRWLQSSLFFHQKRDINAPRSISLSS